MNKRVVKLNNTQLRKLVTEAIQGRQPGSPMFTPPKQKRNINEVAGTPSVDNALLELIEAVRGEFLSMYSDSDPSMAPHGFEGWEAQCANAVTELMSEIGELIEKRTDELTDGVFI